MDDFFLHLAELARAGWSLQVVPEQVAPTLPATRATVLWSFDLRIVGRSADELDNYPPMDWINLSAPEIELRNAVAKMHASIFRSPPFGNITARKP